MKSIFTLFFFIASFFSLKASNIPGADMSYVYLGSGNYKIIITAYRDCNGVQMSSGNATITSGKTTFSLSLKTESVEDITNVTKSCVQSKCVGGSYFGGLEKHVFYGIVNLGSYTNLCEFNVSWSMCCRNGAINTGASGANFYVDMNINRCYDSTNSAPQFTMRPLSSVVEGEPISYNPIMIDSMDGYDSLSYEMVLPLSGAGTGIKYTGSYSVDAPISYLGFPKTGLKLPAGYTLDNLGNLRFTPTKEGEQTVLVMKVTEWKNIGGTMRIVSEIKRDMQVYVAKSKNHEPQTKVFKDFTACVGNPYIFEIPFTDIDTATVLHARIISEISGLTFKVIGDKSSENNKTNVKIEVTPTKSMVRNEPYLFTVIVNDSNCNNNGKDAFGEFIYTYRLYIKDAIDSSAPPLIKFSKFCNSFKLKGSDSLGFGYTNWEWFADTNLISSAQDTIYTFYKADTTKITLKAYKEGCYVESSTMVFTSTIYHPSVKITPSKTGVCRNKEIILYAKASGVTKPVTYYWPELNVYGDTIIELHKNSKYKVQITDSNGCMDSTEMYISLYENPSVTLGNDTSKCTNDLNGITLTAHSDTKSTLYYYWDGVVKTKSIKVNPLPGQNIYKVIVSDSNYCSSSDSILITGYTINIYAGKDTTSCEKLANYPLIGLTSANPLNSQFEWQYLSKTQNVNLDILKTKTFTFTVKDSLGCLVSDDVTITIASPPFVNLSPFSVCDKDSFKLSAIITGKEPFIYKWQIDNNTFLGNKIQVLAPSNIGTHYANLEVSDGNSCVNKDSVLIQVKALPNVTAKVTDFVCKATGNTINLNDQVSPAGGKWTENGVQINNIYKPAAEDSGYHQLVYTYTNPSSSCSNSDKVFIYLVEPSEIDFYGSTTFGSGPLKVDFTSIVKSYSPTTTYQWFFGDPQNSSDFSQNTSFVYDKMGIYSVRLLVGSNGYCPDEELQKKNYIQVSAGASVNEINNVFIQVYPVPSKGKVLVSVPFRVENLNFEWLDMSGRKIGDKIDADMETEINISTPGIYVLKIFNGNNFIGTKKLVIE